MVKVRRLAETDFEPRAHGRTAANFDNSSINSACRPVPVLSKIDFRRLRRVSREIASAWAMSGKVLPAAICAVEARRSFGNNGPERVDAIGSVDRDAFGAAGLRQTMQSARP